MQSVPLNIQNQKSTEWFQHSDPIKFKDYQTSCDDKIFEFVRTQLKSQFKVTKKHVQPLKAILYHLQLSAHSNRPVEISITDNRPVKNILKALESLKMVDFKRGRSDVKEGYSYLSKFQPTDEMRKILCKVRFKLNDIEHVRLVNIKDKDGNVIERKILDGSTPDGKYVSSYNQFIKQHFIQCEFLSGDFDKNDHLYGFAGNFSLNSQVARIYTDEEGVGGRLYNQDQFGVQGLPKKVRKRITIDGEPTDELDFSAYHPCLIYNINKLEAPEAPYQIYRDQSDEMTKCVKLAFNTMLNSKDEEEAVSSTVKQLYCDSPDLGRALSSYFSQTHSAPKECATQLLGDIVKSHPLVQERFYSATWRDLQNIDAQLMLLILDELRSMKIPALPIHDSLIVKQRHRDTAFETMHRIYTRFLDFHTSIKLVGNA